MQEIFSQFYIFQFLIGDKSDNFLHPENNPFKNCIFDTSQFLRGDKSDNLLQPENTKAKLLHFDTSQF